MNAAQVLLFLRNGAASDVDSLFAAFGLTPDNYTVRGLLLGILEDLEAAELIISDPPVRHLGAYSEVPAETETDLSDAPPPSEISEEHLNARLKLSRRWAVIQKALGLSLKELAAVELSRAMFVEPFFGRPKNLPGGGMLDLFVLMPFTDDLEPVYEDHIKAVAERLEFSIERGDDSFTAHDVMKDVWEKICGSRLIIADCTGRNPNVFYEIGIAHTAGKPVILITQNSEDVPFDLRQIRYIQYKYTPRGMKDFEENLTKTIKLLI